MKILIASDVHGSYRAIGEIKAAATREQADEVVLLGDIYNHGPRNPFPEDYAPMKVAEELNSWERLLVIKGNCDSEVDEMISEFPFAESAHLFCDGVRVFCTHGHKINENNTPRGCDLLVYGHFHVGFIKTKDGVTVANPGSAALPKDGSQKGYLLLDGGTLTLKSFDGAILAEKVIRENN